MTMKNFLLTFVFCILLQGALGAQVLSQGNFMIGSSLSFGTSKSKVNTGATEQEGISSRQVNIAPAIGFFVVDYLAMGIGADYTLNVVTQGTEDEIDDSDLLFGPFTRFYLPAGDNVAFFVLGNFGFGNSRNTQLIAGEKQNIETRVFAVGAGPGLTVYTRNGFGIEAIVKYNFARSTFDTDILGVKTSTKTKTNQWALSLGMQYYFGGFRRAG